VFVYNMLNAVRYRYTILAAQVVNFMHQIVYSFAFQQYYARQQTACYLHVLHFVTPEYWCHACNCQTWMSSNIIVLNWAAVSDPDQQIHIHSGRTSTSLTGDGTTFHNPQYGGLSCQWDDVCNITNANGGQISSWLFVDNLSLNFETDSLLNGQD
jgi:hypothetical protein